MAKRGEFREGGPCVSFEIDSLLRAEPRDEFLRQSSFKADLGRARSGRLKVVEAQLRISMPRTSE